MAQDVARQKVFAQVLAFCRTRWQITRAGSRYKIQLFPGTERNDRQQDNDDEKDEIQKPAVTSDGANAYLNLSLVRGTELTFAQPSKFYKI